MSNFKVKVKAKVNLNLIELLCSNWIDYIELKWIESKIELYLVNLKLERNVNLTLN